jgi:hypothetical protein
MSLPTGALLSKVMKTTVLFVDPGRFDRGHHLARRRRSTNS